jgi:hypothetical protein
MKTDDLIRALSADKAPSGPAPALALALAAAAGFVLSVLLFLWLVPLRPHLGEAMRSFPFMLKPVEMGILVVVSAIAVLRLAQPGASLGRVLWVAALVPAIMVVALGFEMASVPRVQWLDRLAGVHWYACVLNMVLMSLPITAALLVGLRFGAPTRPTLAGAGAGLLGGAIAASIYISHCPDDSPIFVAAWFTLAIVIATCIGALAGSRLLRW